MKEIYNKLPNWIKSILLTSEGWLVGNTVKDILENKEPRDFDIVVPSRELFQITVKQIHGFEDLNIGVNTFGGLKIKSDDGIVIDIWCEELDHFLKTANSVNYIFNLKRAILLNKL